MESPASWLSRVALSQYVTTREIRSLSGIGGTKDPDMWCVVDPFAAVAASLGGQTKGSYALVNRILSNLHEVDPWGVRFLLGSQSAPRYRFCPVCLLQDKVKYFRIEWRFRCWLWCPLHCCRLRDMCSVCSAPVRLPADLIRAGPKGWGMATLGRCMACEADLTAGAQYLVDSHPSAVLTEWEQCLLRNGRAVLATLLHGECTIQTEQTLVRKPLKHLPSLEKQGLIPNFSEIPHWV